MATLPAPRYPADIHVQQAAVKKKGAFWGSLAALILLAACDLFNPVEPVLTPRVRPAGLVQPPAPTVQPTSEASASLRRYLTQVQSSQLTAGLLRQDGGGPDTPFTASIGANPNFLVFFVGEDDRIQTLNQKATRLPGVTTINLAPVRNLPKDAYCAVAAYASGADRSAYTAAVAVIRAENPDLLRLSCIHEELAQGLGLANDSPNARPSIFNDDDEFALLTDHDALLLGMLYDPRLKPGQSLADARTTVNQLALKTLGQDGPS